MPTLYYKCGLAYDTKNKYDSSFEMYKAFLIRYPENPLADKVELTLLENPTSCERYGTLQISVIANRTGFMPSLYYHCGQVYEDDKNWKSAITMYEIFLADYPKHFLASEVEAALARVIVMEAKGNTAGEIPAPVSSGSTKGGNTEVVIQNDSPNRLRIVFSGPESHIEELAACSSCTTFTGIGPSSCPEKGPIGPYTLKPGSYDVVVESISDSRTKPWTGNWDLISGKKYSSCFFVVTTLGP